MSTGKAVAQAGHAFLDSFLDALTTSPDAAAQYGALKPGTKIVLSGGTEDDLKSLHQRLQAWGIPCSLIVDSGHIELPDFDGSPVVTALGVGPLSRAQARKHLPFPLWRGNGGGS